MADDGYSRQRIPFSRNNFSGRVIESVELQQNVSSSGPHYVQGPPAPESRPQVTGYSTYEVTSPMQSKCHPRLKNVLSNHPGHVTFLAGQVTFHSH